MGVFDALDGSHAVQRFNGLALCICDFRVRSDSEQTSVEILLSGIIGAIAEASPVDAVGHTEATWSGMR